MYKGRRISLYWLVTVCAVLTVLLACQNRNPAPIWHNLILGSSAVPDVLRELGEPTYKFDDDKSRYTAYSYGPSKSVYMVEEMVVFEGKIVKLIQVHDISSTTGEMLTRYGEPERITWPARNNPCWKRLFIYARQGVAVVADNLTLKGATFEWFYFEPQSADDFLAAFAGSILPAENPCFADKYPEDFWQR